VIGALQCLQTNDWLAMYKVPFTPLHHLYTHLFQVMHKIEFLRSTNSVLTHSALPFAFPLTPYWPWHSQTLFLFSWYSSSDI